MEGKIQKLIRSDVGLIISIVVFLAGILGPWYSVKTDIALLTQKVETFKEDLTMKENKDEKQDALITQNATDISGVKGQLTSRINLKNNYEITN